MLFESLKSDLVEKRSHSDNSGGFFNLFSGVTRKGKPVNDQTALTLSAFYNGVQILCNDYAKLPKSVYRKEDDNRVKVSDHELTFLVSKKPNSYMTAFTFDEVMLQSALLKGNAYAIIKRSSLTGKTLSIEFVDQSVSTVKIFKTVSGLLYEIDGNRFLSTDILHIKGMSSNGIVGVSVLQYAAQSLGLSISAQEYASDYYDTKGEGTGIVTSQKDLKPEQIKAYSGALSNALSADKKFKVAVLDSSSSFQHIKLTPQEAQFLQTAKAGVEEVARWLNLPPHKIKSLENATFSNIEHQEISHISDSILPWALKFKAEYDTKLFSDSELKSGHYFHFNHNSLLRADLTTQAEYFAKMIFCGVFTRNEVRKLLDFNAILGLDEPLTPVNAQTLELIDAKLNELKSKTENE